MIPPEFVDTFNRYAVPVIVALLTTLVVEYFAKPRLDARKARLLRDRQQIDEVIFGFQKVAMLAAALLPNSLAAESTDARDVQRRQIERLAPAIESLLDAISRLPSVFVRKHARHVGDTAVFVSFLQGVASVEGHKTNPDADRLSEIGADVSAFDAYFAAHASFRDSQERWVKRAFSRLFMSADYRSQAENALRRSGLRSSSE